MLYSTLLIMHIATGFAMLTAKGSTNHIRAGLIYTYAMYGVGFTSVTMSLLKFNPFLLAIGIFATYMTYMGKHAIAYYRTRAARPFTHTDRLPAYIAFVVAFFMIAAPIYQMLVAGQVHVSVLGVFGVILLIMSVQDMKMQGKELHPRNKKWLIRHIGMTGGAYISTFTAFVVTNVHVQPEWLPWLLPSLIGSILIRRSTRTWKKKLKITA